MRRAKTRFTATRRVRSYVHTDRQMQTVHARRPTDRQTDRQSQNLFGKRLLKASIMRSVHG